MLIDREFQVATNRLKELFHFLNGSFQILGLFIGIRAFTCRRVRLCSIRCGVDDLRRRCRLVRRHGYRWQRLHRRISHVQPGADVHIHSPLKVKSGRARKHTPPPKLYSLLLKQFQYSGWQLVSLGQNRSGSLLQSLLLGQVSRFSCEVGVLNTTQCSGGVFVDVLQVGNGAGQTVLRSTQVCAGFVDLGQCGVDRGDRVVDAAASAADRYRTAGNRQGSSVELGAQNQVDAVGRTYVRTYLQGHGASRTVQQGFAVQVGRLGDTSQFVRHLAELGVQSATVSSAVGVVAGLNSQFTHTLQNVGRFLQSAFSGLSHRDAVVGVLDCYGLATDLRSFASGDLQAGRVVFSAVDFQAGRQTSHRSRQSIGCFVEVLLNIQGSYVSVYC